MIIFQRISITIYLTPKFRGPRKADHYVCIVTHQGEFGEGGTRLKGPLQRLVRLNFDIVLLIFRRMKMKFLGDLIVYAFIFISTGPIPG